MNPFTVLGLPERVAVSPATVMERFRELSAAHHPDGQGASSADRERFTEINQAYGQLRTAGGRLKALLQARFPEAWETKGSLPDGLLGLFSRVSAILQRADAFLARKAKASTALAEALLAPDLLSTREQLIRAGNLVEQHLERAEARLPGIDAAIDGCEATAQQEASALCQEVLYLEKWQSQIRNRIQGLF